MSQSVKDALADAETLRRFLLADVNIPGAIGVAFIGLGNMPPWIRARYDAHKAFRAVPGLRG